MDGGGIKDIPAPGDPRESDTERLLQEIREDTVALSRAGIARIILDSNSRYDSDADSVDLDMVHFHVERDSGEPEEQIPPSTNIVMLAIWESSQGKYSSTPYQLNEDGILGVPDEANRLTREQIGLINRIADSRPPHPNEGGREVAALNSTLPGNNRNPV